MPKISETNSNTTLFNAGIAAGVIGTPPTFLDNTDGTYDLGEFDVLLYDNVNQEGGLKQFHFDVDAGRDLTSTPNEVRYLVADYNSGTPQLVDLTFAQLSQINESTIVPIFTMYVEWDGASTYQIHQLHWDTLGQGLPNMLHKRFVKTDRFRRETGVELGYSDPSMYVTIGSGRYWLGAVEHDLDAFNTATAGHRWYFWYTSSGSWTRTITTDGSGTYNNTQYDNGTDLVTLTDNYYTVNWIYRDLEQNPHAGYVLGDAEYETYGEALAAQPRTDLPTEFSVVSALVGRIIVQKGQTVATSTNSLVESAFDTIYQGATITEHNNIAGKQGGVLDEYYHLDLEQKEHVLHGIGDVATTISFDDSTHVFTITGTNWHYYYKGEYVEIASSVTVDLDTVGSFPTQGDSYFIYFADNTGTLTASTSVWDLFEHCPVALVTWNSPIGTGNGALFNERHAAKRNVIWHRWAHSTVNTRYLTGFEKTLPTTATDNDIEISTGQIADEDIITDVTTNQTNVRIWYEVQDGVWTFEGVSGSEWQLPYYDDTHPTGGTPQWPITTSTAFTDQVVTITVDTTTTGTATNANTTDMSIGMSIASTGTGSVGTNAIITEILSGTSFTFSCDTSTHSAGDTTTLTGFYRKVTLASGKYMPTWVYATPDEDYPIYVVVPSMTANNLYNSPTEAREAPLPVTHFIQEGKLLHRFIFDDVGQLTYDAGSDDFRTSGLVATAGSSGNISAAQVSFTPYDNISATTVQGALEEINDEEKIVRLDSIRTTTSETLTIDNAGQFIQFSNTGTVTFTIPANASVAFPVGTRIDLLNINSGQVNVAITSDTLNSKGSLVGLTQGSKATLVKTATTTWWLYGDLA